MRVSCGPIQAGPVQPSQPASQRASSVAVKQKKWPPRPAAKKKKNRRVIPGPPTRNAHSHEGDLVTSMRRHHVYGLHAPPARRQACMQIEIHRCAPAGGSPVSCRNRTQSHGQPAHGMTYTVTQYIIIGPSLFGGTNTHTRTREARPRSEVSQSCTPPSPQPQHPPAPTSSCPTVASNSTMLLCMYVPTLLWTSYPPSCRPFPPLVVARRFEPAFRCDPICLVSVLALHLLCVPLTCSGWHRHASTPPRGAPNLGQPCERHVRLLSYNRPARLSNSSVQPPSAGPPAGGLTRSAKAREGVARG